MTSPEGIDMTTKTRHRLGAMDYVTGFSAGICVGTALITVLGWVTL